MELTHLIEGLTDPNAYPDPVQAIEVRHTHISVVLLTGPFVYKIKKPVNLGFLDFSTLDKRRHFCEEEVRLNRRLAPGVYKGVVPITATSMGLKVNGPGEVVEWAVKMTRLPEDATLLRRLEAGQLRADTLQELAHRIAAFHACADRSDRIAACGRYETVWQNALENFDQSASQIGRTVSSAVWKRLRQLTIEALEALRPLIEARALRGITCDTHGDLHLDHVYHFPGQQAPDDLVVLDCIEFNDRFRYADPVADTAFLVMDLEFQGRKDLAQIFTDAYFDAAADAEGRELLPFYSTYRSVVRAKVEGIEVAEKEIPPAERREVLGKSRAHWLLALGLLEKPAKRPCLVLVGGLPGTGKSSLARELAERANFQVLRTDVIRKELARISGLTAAANRPGEGLYSADWTARTYDECLRRAKELLLDGQRVLVDAGFWEDSKRRQFFAAARRIAVPSVLLICQTDPESVRQRLNGRLGDASDADWSVYTWAAQRWQEPDPTLLPYLRKVHTSSPSAVAGSEALAVLAEFGLWNE